MRSVERWPDMDDLDDTRAVVRPPTVLYNIAPIGVGTGRVEGLNSYLIRLANEHCLNVRTLIREVIVRHAQSLQATQQPGFNHQAALSINGGGFYAQSFADTLNALTGRSDITRLTLLPFATLLAANGPGLLTTRRKWCPQCLIAELRMSRPVYQPLVWSFVLYKMCTIHGTQMVDRCPHCDRTQPFIPRLPTVHHCAFCRKSLFTSVDIQSEIISPAEMPVQTRDGWLSHALENLLSFGAKYPGHDLRAQFVTRLKNIISVVGGGWLANFYRRTGLPMNMCKNWLRRDEKPSLPQFLRLAHAVDLMPSELLSANDEEMPSPGIDGLGLFKPAIAIASPLINRACKSNLDINDRYVIARAIVLALNAEPPPNVSTFAKQLGTTTFAIRYWFPAEYSLLSERARSNRRAMDAARDTNRRALILQYVGELSMLGVAPSKNRVEETLKIDNLTLRGREMSAYFRQVQTAPIAPRGIMYTRPNSYVHETVISTPRKSDSAEKSREAALPAGKK